MRNAFPEVCRLTLNVVTRFGFTQARFSSGQVGGAHHLIPTLLLWYGILSSLLFVPHGFECLSVITDSQKSPQVLLLTWHEILSAFF